MKTELPQVKETPHKLKDDEVHYTHPAFATIAATRSNGVAMLFDTKVQVDGFVSISIHEAELIEGAYHDHVFGHGKRVIEVLLSESQWVGFISRMNIGSGVPCTLRYRQTGPMIDVPQLPTVERSAERLRRSAQAIPDAAIKKADDRLKELEEIIATIPKGKADKIRNLIDLIANQTMSNIAYGRETLTEHAEKLIVEATVEINAKVQGMVTALGLKHISEFIQLSHEAHGDDSQPE